MSAEMFDKMTYYNRKAGMLTSREIEGEEPMDEEGTKQIAEWRKEVTELKEDFKNPEEFLKKPKRVIENAHFLYHFDESDVEDFFIKHEDVLLHILYQYDLGFLKFYPEKKRISRPSCQRF